MGRMKVKGAQAQGLKAQVCGEANQLRALRGEQRLGQLLLGHVPVSWAALLGCCLRNRAYVPKKTQKTGKNTNQTKKLSPLILLYLLCVQLCVSTLYLFSGF